MTGAGTVSNASSSSRENLLDNPEEDHDEHDMNTTADTDDFYDDTADTSASLQQQSSMESKDFGETYEVMENTLETTGTGSSGGHDDNYPEDEELYEDVATATDTPVRPPKQEARKPEPLTSPKREPLPERPTTNQRPQPPVPTTPTAMTQNPTMAMTNLPQIIPTNGNEEPWVDDYDNIYIAKWDCNPDDNDELGFKRGDLLHILSREYDVENWWVAEKNAKVGIVPKDYLWKAYEL